jgi:hypothetical protein
MCFNKIIITTLIILSLSSTGGGGMSNGTKISCLNSFR